MPVRYFQGLDDDYYYQMVGKNREVMATSEGYTTESDARRGFKDLATEVISMVRDMELLNERLGSPAGEVSESEVQTDVQEADEVGEGQNQDPEADGEGFSKHDEVPHDNPDALKED
jgi:hypothetical protein